LLIPTSIKNSVKIITDSNYVKQDIVSTYSVSDSKIEVVYAAPSEKFINKNLSREKIILTVSSIDPRKNLERAIKAFNRLDSEYKLVIVGQKNKTFSKVGFNSTDLSKNVIFTGYLTDEKLIDLYNRSELFIYASLFEGFGIPPLEAQACGCACIISNATSLPEVYKTSAEYFDPNSIDSITTKLKEVLNNKNRIRELQEKSAINFKRFKWDKSTNKLISIIEKTT
jgi:glycosyltransferase involved in cell wall biosynthesis